MSFEKKWLSSGGPNGDLRCNSASKQLGVFPSQLGVFSVNVIVFSSSCNVIPYNMKALDFFHVTRDLRNSMTSAGSLREKYALLSFGDFDTKIP